MRKEDILKELSEGKTVSGQDLAARYGVSRSAVWKAVNALKREGYGISGTNGAGYTLSETDVLRPSQIAADARAYAEKTGLRADLDGFEILCLASVGSTNDEAKRLAVTDGKNRLIAAGGQTAGRGRLGRSFYSPEKTGAYFSLALHGERDFSRAVAFTSLAAVATCRAIENLTGLSPSIKWVNDVYVGGKKVCGILTEAVADVESGKVSDVIIGIGVNLTTERFPEDVPSAASLGTKGLTRSALLSAIALEIIEEIPYIAQNRHIPYYREHSFLTGKRIRFTAGGGATEGTAAGIDDGGGLIVRLESGETVTLTSGEVTVRVR